jgi:hypothetical protein
MMMPPCLVFYFSWQRPPPGWSVGWRCRNNTTAATTVLLTFKKERKAFHPLQWPIKTRKSVRHLLLYTISHFYISLGLFSFIPH